MSRRLLASRVLTLVTCTVIFSSAQAGLTRNSRPLLEIQNAADTNLGSQRINLVVAAIGDSSIHERWFEGFDEANWDLAAFYFGERTNFTCDQCVHVESGSGTKWSFLYNFAQSEVFQTQFAKQYKQLYVTDDDIAQTAASMSRAFALMQQYGLHLAQPSLCSGFESHTWQPPLFRDSRMILRFTTFVEIMVPMFSMEFFTSQVVATLENAQTGYGLDWVWPYLLGYPQEKIAIIHAVCVVHPKGELQPGKKVSMYQAHNPAAEEGAVLARFQYDPNLLQTKYGLANHEIAWLGAKWEPWYQELLTKAGITVVYDVKNAAYGPHKGFKFISTGTTIAAKLRIHHHIRTITTAFKSLSTEVESTIAKSGQSKFLVIVAVPDRSRWLQYNSSATYDTLAIAALKDVKQVQQACQHCVTVFGHHQDVQAGRYAVLHELSQDTQWQQQFSEGYDYFYFPEEDMVQTVESVNRMFELSAEYELSLAQPSWCSQQDTVAKQPDLQMHGPLILRYVTYVETLAPIWSRSFWDEFVVPSLQHSDSGCGLDYIWPYLAGYPADKIAVIDDICAMRPINFVGPSALTKASKLSQDEISLQCQAEENKTLVSIDYQPLEKYLLPDKPYMLMNWVLQPWYEKLLAMDNLKVTPVHTYNMHLFLDETPDTESAT